VTLALLLLLLPLGEGTQGQSRRPTLVVLLTVDQMRGDYLDRFADGYTGGLARLRAGGAVYTDGRQDHGVTETAPGHSTIGSGRHPASTGILRNTEGVPDDSFPLLEVAGTGASPRRFSGTTLTDWLVARWPRSRTLSVSLKDRGAILPVGRSRQQVYWYAGGQFTTSRWYADSLPAWVREFNQGLPPTRAPDRVWTLQKPRAAYPEPDTADYENYGESFFPHAMPADARAAAEEFRRRPWADSVTLALALEGVRQLRLGRGTHVDLLAVSLSVTDYIGHRFGPNSVEIHDQMLWLDRYLGAFMDALEQQVGSARVLYVLTADHGITAFPEWSREHGVPGAAYLQHDVDSILIDALGRLQSDLGAGRWIRYRDVGLVVFDRDGLRERGLDPDSLAEVVAAELRPIEGLLRVDTRQGLRQGDTTVAGVRRWRHHVGRVLAGDVLLTPAEDRVLARPGEAHHGHASEADTWVPIVFMGPGIRPGRYEGRANTVDIAPTVARSLGVRPAERVDGRVLEPVLIR
jgi:predicted AlkP superfamily pyrophosphatase or phosphodiesterase